MSPHANLLMLYPLYGVKNERTAAKQRPVGETLPPTAERGEAAAEPGVSIQSTTDEVSTGELRPARPLGETAARPYRAGEPHVRGGLETREGAETPTRRVEPTEPGREEEKAPAARHVPGGEPIREPALQHAETIDTITVGKA